MCLEYVDNAVNAPKRTATAQIAYETAKGNGWYLLTQNILKMCGLSCFGQLTTTIMQV